MRKITFLLFCLLFLFNSCSSDDSNGSNSIPNKFEIRLKVNTPIGHLERAFVSINSSIMSEWENFPLPFDSQYTYNLVGHEIKNSSCRCITIDAWAYLNELDNIESFELYVNGELVDSTTTVSPANSEGELTPTKLQVIYTP